MRVCPSVRRGRWSHSIVRRSALETWLAQVRGRAGRSDQVRSNCVICAAHQNPPMQQAVGSNVVISVAESAGGNGRNRADLALMAGDVVIAGWPSLLYRPLSPLWLCPTSIAQFILHTSHIPLHTATSSCGSFAATHSLKHQSEDACNDPPQDLLELLLRLGHPRHQGHNDRVRLRQRHLE